MLNPPIPLRQAIPASLMETPLRKEDLEDTAIEVISIAILEGEFGDFARIGIRLNEEQRVFITGAGMILERLLAAKEHFPVICIVRKQGRAWLVE